jgi:SMC interacting uncharacterized protein involved in chromosome segregation
MSEEFARRLEGLVDELAKSLAESEAANRRLVGQLEEVMTASEALCEITERLQREAKSTSLEVQRITRTYTPSEGKTFRIHGGMRHERVEIIPFHLVSNGIAGKGVR